VSHFYGLDHFSEFFFIIHILDLREGSNITERIQVPIPYLKR
jgi:hypothetical protein